MVVAVGTEMSQELPVDYEIPEDGVCGVCGRLVRGHNPSLSGGRDQYSAMNHPALKFVEATNEPD